MGSSPRDLGPAPFFVWAPDTRSAEPGPAAFLRPWGPREEKLRVEDASAAQAASAFRPLAPQPTPFGSAGPGAGGQRRRRRPAPTQALCYLPGRAELTSATCSWAAGRGPGASSPCRPSSAVSPASGGVLPSARAHPRGPLADPRRDPTALSGRIQATITRHTRTPRASAKSASEKPPLLPLFSPSPRGAHPLGSRLASPQDPAQAQHTAGHRPTATKMPSEREGGS